jgi:hypothetical protein
MITKEQKIINALEGQFPIKVYPEREILAKLRETFEGFEIKPNTILEIHGMIDLGDEGGIGCDIRPIGLAPGDMKTAFLCSITHFRIKIGEPLYEELEKYRIKRIKKLALQNRFR